MNFWDTTKSTIASAIIASIYTLGFLESAVKLLEMSPCGDEFLEFLDSVNSYHNMINLSETLLMPLTLVIGMLV